MMAITLTVQVAFKCKTIKSFMMCVGGVLIITFLIGGIMTSSLTTKIEILTTGTFCILVLYKYLEYFKTTKWKARNTYQIELPIEKQTLHLNAFLDTGNFLTYGISEYPVVIISKNVIEGKISVNLKNILANEIKETPNLDYLKNIKMVEYHGVDGAVKSTYGLKVKSAKIKGDKNIVTKDVVIILSKQNFKNYDALIGLSALEGGLEFGDIVSIKSKSQEIFC